MMDSSSLVGCGAKTLSLASVQMDDTNQSKQPSSPANYVTILELKERWLKAKEQKEKEEKEQQEEELRQRKLKQEEEKQRNLNAVVQVTETDSKFRIPNIRTRFRPANRGVSEPEGGAELEGKSEGPEEKNLGKKKKKKKKKKKNVRAEKEEVVADKEGTVHAPPEASSEEKLNEAAIGNEEREGIDIQIRANSENVGSAEEIGQKFGDLSVKGETEKRDGRLRRPSKVDKHGIGEIGGYRRLGLRQRGVEQVWVKKGEVFNGNVHGVQSSERSDAISGQTGTTLNASSLKLAGKISKSNPRQWKRTNPKKVYGPVKL